MYLKSLTLKGFKSFADRAVMKFEPGVTAIVGPNGSGKSNISDAVLWVLGERNAKNLRGQAMEDVIFSGSSARKAVSVAEVELLLDNSDGTLPVDFDEVSIGRRMYRSGESEYLINGNVVRRMDVLDVLHDSGLGTGTNSIISQGNLDSVLSSKPEDRRSLIEEAAGILKHKERKTKSMRKLARMDNHLDRVKDVTAEVERQLKPLERKAKRALAFKDLSAELDELKLQIAVDDLRCLQREWDEVGAREERAITQTEELRAAVTLAEAELDALQQQLLSRGATENSLNSGFRRANSAHERLNSALMVIREKRRTAFNELERISKTIEENKVACNLAQKELADAQDSFSQIDVSYKTAQESLNKLELAYKENVSNRDALRKKVDTLFSQQRAIIHKIETNEAKKKALQDNLNENLAKAQVLELHLVDAKQRLESITKEAEEASVQANDLLVRFEEVKENETQSREAQNKAFREREEARRALDEARNDFNHLSAERNALEEFERTSEASNAALSWLLEGQRSTTYEYLLLTHILTAPSNLEPLVESLLGDYLHALVTDDLDSAVEIARGLWNTNLQGEVAFLSNEVRCDGALPDVPYERLYDLLSVDTRYAHSVEALLGRVYLVNSVDDAQHAHALYPDVSFVTTDGFMITDAGIVCVMRASEEQKLDSVLARRRKLQDLLNQENEAEQCLNAAKVSVAHLESAVQECQARTLRFSEQVASLRGQTESALQNKKRLEDLKEASQREYDRLLREEEQNKAALDKAQPTSDELDTTLVSLNEELRVNKKERHELSRTLDPLQKTILSMSDSLSDARLEVARLSERAAYASRMVETRRAEIASLAREEQRDQERFHKATIASKRVDPLLATLGILSASAQVLAVRLEEQSREAQTFSQGLHESIASATAKSRAAHESFDRSNAGLADIRIAKGRLEVQVETALKVIEEDCSTPIETALEMNELNNRAEAVSQAEKIERRMKNMGTINPDAAEEYKLVLERYEYLTSQLNDMKSARQSLSRIVSVIDERMRDDFINTFNQVNDNFSAIFETLFPGGHAQLALTDPDDLENSGVDVNAQPVGKRIKKMSLLSGGEKSMTAMALLFAVYGIRQTPFYILDEVEAALDDSNLRRLISYLNTIRSNTQFIMITHQRRTMESADILYGVSMQADGVTKVLSQKLEKSLSKGE